MDTNYNRLRTPVRLEDNKVLKIPVLKAETKYNRSSNLEVILLLFISNHLYRNSVINNGVKSCLQSLIQSYPHDSVLVQTYMNALNISYSLKDYSSLLHIQNKASTRTTFGTFFFHSIPFKAPQNLKTAERK